MTYNIGDIVRLKSGGPPMIVTGTTTEDDVIVHWFETLFNRGTDLRLAHFTANLLEVVPPEVLSKHKDRISF